MYDKGKIIVGIVVFLILVLFPFWFGRAQGDGGVVRDATFLSALAELREKQGPCVRDGMWMRGNHMVLLDQWRDHVVRDGIWVDEESGQKMSLTRTCMTCHSTMDVYSGETKYSGTSFCVQCHERAGVAPNCWDCHNEPGES